MATHRRTDASAAPVQPRRLGDLLQAEQDCRRRLEADPFDAEALRSLGDIKQAFGQHAEAVSFYQEALRLRTADADCARSLGNALYLLGRFPEAATTYRHVIGLRPDDADAHCNLGAALADQGLLVEALACYEEALRVRPDFMNAHYNLGNAFRLLERFAEAALSYAQALRLRSDFAEGHNNLGIALFRQGRLAEAIVSYRQAILHNPRFTKAHTNLGLAMAESGRLSEALACYQEAIRLEPSYPDAHRNRSLVWLLQGDHERAWPEYEWRWRCNDFTPPRFPQPVWNGAPLKGQTVLLYTEQGMGDTLQFVRFARLVQERGGRVLLAAPEPLHPLLAGCEGVDKLIAREVEPSAFDVHCPLMSLPAVLGLGHDVLPSAVPYLRTDPALVNHWRGELEPLRGLKVGIAWQGNPKVLYDRVRSIPLRSFEPLARVEGVQLISLQKGYGSEQLAALEGRFPVFDLAPRLDEATGPFLDTAAVLASLDLVITCDTVLAHVAGALGVRAWVVLPAVPDWRWYLDRTDSPWYPSLRLFRQTHPGSWAEPFEQMAEALRSEVSAAGQRVTIAVSPGELIDRITILEIKQQRITDPHKLHHVQAELTELLAKRDQAVACSAALEALAAELRRTNEAIWQVEDDLRLAENQADFGTPFVALARAVYHHNDHRAALKRQINDLLGSERHEEKLYTSYPAENPPITNPSP
ncbi:MAG TPA: DUF6165 family protein [Isosphaeraceae bacterium]|nr:DUF6165 family protein [Isosphaeraceae bacterium]